MKMSDGLDIVPKRARSLRTEQVGPVVGADGSLQHKPAKFKSYLQCADSPLSDISSEEPVLEECRSAGTLLSENHVGSGAKESPEICRNGTKMRAFGADASNVQLRIESRTYADWTERKTKRACEYDRSGIPGFSKIVDEIYDICPEVVKIEETYSDGVFDEQKYSSIRSACGIRERDNHGVDLEKRTESTLERSKTILDVEMQETCLKPFGYRSHGAAERGSANSKFRIPARVGSNCNAPYIPEMDHNVPGSMPHPRPFRTPYRLSTTSMSSVKFNDSRGKMEAKLQSKYYCVMYCTWKPNAKHKGPWSDGILICRACSSVLQDAEGKVISNNGDHRGGDLREGATLIIGKFEVEVMRICTEEEFLSGKIFLGGMDVQCNAVVELSKKRAFTGFQAPAIKLKGVSTYDEVATTHVGPTAEVRPILGKDALVLNAKDLQETVLPVFVDPYIALKLRPHQREGVKFMYECVMGLRDSSFTGCLLADAMGLGKTLQVIALIWTLIKQGPGGHPAIRRVLVICPSSLVENWGKEVRKWLGSERLNPLVVHSGTPVKDVKRKIANFQVGKTYNLLITSYELLRKHKDDLKSANPGLLVCDEAHRLKNCAGNKTIDALLDLNCSKRLILTGTPIQNDLMEFYAMIDFVNPNLLGPLSAFKRLYANPIEKSRDRNASEMEKELGCARSAELQLKTRFCILQRSADVNSKYLPKKIEFVVFCKLQPRQVALYQGLLRSKLVSESLTSGQSHVVLSAIGTLRKLCNHPKLVESELNKGSGTGVSPGSGDVVNAHSGQPFKRQERTSADWRLSGKLACLHRLLSAVHESSSSGSKDKMVVVSNFTQTLDIIQMLCEGQGWSWLRLDGSTDVSERQSLVERFNSNYSEESVFLLSSKAGGSGLNLIGANRLVLFDPDWNPATDAQAMARVWRDGQTKTVFIYRLLTTASIEEKIYQRQIMKGEVAAAVEEQIEGQFAGGDGGGRRHFTREELQELFTLRLETSCETYDLLSQSDSSHSNRWRDFSKEVEDQALKEAIHSGVVTFVYQHIDNKDTKSLVDNNSRYGVEDSTGEDETGPDGDHTDPSSICFDTVMDDIDEPLLECDAQNLDPSRDEDIKSIPDLKDEQLPVKRCNGCGTNSDRKNSETFDADLNDVNSDTNPAGLSPAPNHTTSEVFDCLLKSKTQKVLQQLVDLRSPDEFDEDDLEVLDVPFLCTLDLEMELKRANFASEDLWLGLKLFAIGFLYGVKEQKVSYAKSKLGIVLDKCSLHQSSDEESIFCKGFPLVRAIVNRRHGHEAADLLNLFNCYEQEEDLRQTSSGRFVLGLMDRWKEMQRTRRDGGLTTK